MQFFKTSIYIIFSKYKYILVHKAISKNLKKLLSNAHVIQRQPGKLGQGPIGNQLMTTNTDLA